MTEIFMEKSKNEYDAFLENAPFAVVISDGEGIIKMVNAVAERMFGYKSSELVGKTVEFLMPEGFRESHVKRRISYNANPKTRMMGGGLDLIGRKKNGEEFPIEIGLSYSHNSDGIEVISCITDITKRKHIEQDRISKVEDKNVSMERELHMAHQVQVTLLPRQFPNIPGWSFAAKWLPAREVAGDFYDIIQRDDNNVDLLIADVTDKGMPAALFMAFTRTVLRASLADGSSLVEGIDRTNRLMDRESSQGYFVTLFLTRLNHRTGEMGYVNAGHDPPLIYSHKENKITSLTRTGMPLGIRTQEIHEQCTAQLDPNDFILFYTDGVTEAFNGNKQFFGEERLQQVIWDHRYSSAEDIVNSLSQAVNDFIGPATVTDDITILVVKRL